MYNRANISEIARFLEWAKMLICADSFDFVPRRKNMISLAEHGMTILEAKEEILDLKTSDYYKGPKKDFDKPGEIWEFKKIIGEVLFYIKLKIVSENQKDVLKCIGFHKDEFE